VLLSFVRATREHAREPNILSTIHAAPPNRRDEPRHTRHTAHRSPDRGLRTPLTAAPPLRASVPPDRGRPQSADNGHPTLTAPAPAAAQVRTTPDQRPAPIDSPPGCMWDVCGLMSGDMQSPAQMRAELPADPSTRRHNQPPHWFSLLSKSSACQRVKVSSKHVRARQRGELPRGCAPRLPDQSSFELGAAVFTAPSWRCLLTFCRIAHPQYHCSTDASTSTGAIRCACQAITCADIYSL